MKMHTMRFGLIGVVLTYLDVAGAEIAFHWYIATSNSAPGRFLEILYFSKDERGRVEVPHKVLILIPGLALGIAAGIFGVSWPPRVLAACASILALGQVALYPLYASFFPHGRWWSQLDVDPHSVGLWGLSYFKTLCLCLLGAFGARQARQDMLRRRRQPTPRRQPGMPE